MKEKSKLLKKIVAIIFENINAKNIEKGINAQYKYVSQPIEVDDDSDKTTKGWEISIVMGEMGYKERTLQTFSFERPNDVDKFSMEYNMFTLVLTALTETSLITWLELGKNLNKDKGFQKEAINSLNNDKETNKNTDK